MKKLFLVLLLCVACPGAFAGTHYALHISYAPDYTHTPAEQKLSIVRLLKHKTQNLGKVTWGFWGHVYVVPTRFIDEKGNYRVDQVYVLTAAGQFVHQRLGKAIQALALYETLYDQSLQEEVLIVSIECPHFAPGACGLRTQPAQQNLLITLEEGYETLVVEKESIRVPKGVQVELSRSRTVVHELTIQNKKPSVQRLD